MLNLTISNITSTKGQILIAVFDHEDAFLDVSKAVRLQALPIANAGAMQVRYDDLPEGTYSVSIVHDLNSNGKLDTNIFGVPTEPYGFSQNVRPKLRAARWDEAKFGLSAKSGAIDIRLDTW